jgi:hypothetical protein
MKRLTPLAVTILIAACQPAYLKGGQPNPDSPYFDIPVDSELVLHKDVTLPPYQKDLFFQNGKVSDYAGVNKWHPYCALSVHAKTQVPQIVKADSFVVEKVGRQFLFQLAAADFQVAQLDRGGGFQQWQVLATVMEISSDRQPGVVQMTCAAWGLPQDMSNVTLNTIRKALGEAATLKVADIHGTRPATGGPTDSKGPGY